MLTAVDVAVMVIDAAMGVGGADHQASWRCAACAPRPSLPFVNKLDREVREPVALLEEIEAVLKIDCAPVTWPIGMGRRSVACITCCMTGCCASRRARSAWAKRN